MANGFGVPLSNAYIVTAPPAHSELTFACLARSATGANRFHFQGANLVGPQEAAMQNRQIRLFSSSFVNSPGRGNDRLTFPEYLHIVDASNWGTPLFDIIPANNCGETASCDSVINGAGNTGPYQSIVSGAAWEPLVVGNVYVNGRMAPLWDPPGVGRCSSSENWPATVAGNPENDYELPNMVAPGTSSGYTPDATTWDSWVDDPLAQTTSHGVEKCGTSFAAPLTVGAAADVMSQFTTVFNVYPEVAKAALMLNAVNAWGQDQYMTWDPTVMLPCGGSTCMSYIDGVDGTGALDALQAGNWVNAVKAVRSYPIDHPNHDGVARGSGIAYFLARKSISGKYFGSDLFNADNDYSFAVKFPNALNGCV
jgi:hypothetical protein